MSGFTGNLAEMREALMIKRQRVIDSTEHTAQGMVDIFTKNTQPLARVETGKWQRSIGGKAEEVGEGVWDIWLGSEGAFSPEGFNYGAFWNFWDGTIDTGLFISQPEFEELHKKDLDEAMAD